MGGGGGSRSSSRTSNTYNTDNRTIHGNQGTAIQGGSGDITLTQTDHGAIDKSFDFASQMAGESFGFGNNALNFANDLGSQSISASQDSLHSSLDFARDVGAGAIEMLGEQMMNNQLAIQATNSNAMNALMSTQEKAFNAVKSEDAQSTDKLMGLGKTALYAGAAVIAVIGLMFVFANR